MEQGPLRPGGARSEGDLLRARVEVEDTAADGDHVVVRWRARGTYLGGGLGMPATGRPVGCHGMTGSPSATAVIVEGWDSWNLRGMLQTLRLGQTLENSEDLAAGGQQ